MFVYGKEKGKPGVKEFQSHHGGGEALFPVSNLRLWDLWQTVTPSYKNDYPIIHF